MSKFQISIVCEVNRDEEMSANRTAEFICQLIEKHVTELTDVPCFATIELEEGK